MLKAVTYFFINIADFIRMWRIGFDIINDFDSDLEEVPCVSQLPIKELKNIMQEAQDEYRVNKNAV